MFDGQGNEYRTLRELLESAAMEKEGFVGYTATDDVVVTAIHEAELLAQRVSREDVIALEDVRTRAGALYIFSTRIDTKDLPGAHLRDLKISYLKI